MDSLISNPDSVILNQLFSILNESFSCGEGVRGLFKTLGIGALKLVASLIVQRLVRSGDAWGVLKFVMLRILYRKHVLSKSKRNDAAVIESFTSLVTPATPTTSTQGVATNSTQPKPSQTSEQSVWVSGFPVYLEKEGMEYAMYSMPFIHTPFVYQLTESATAELRESQIITTICKDTNGREYTPLNLFPSNNYMMLDDVVHTHFITHRDTGMVTPPFIVLNGVGGLGKSLSAGFLAHQRKYGEVRHYSLIAQNMVTRSFSSIVNEVMSTRTPHSTVIYFDELDKYVDMYTRYAYTTAQRSPNAIDVAVASDFAVFASDTKKSILMTISELSNNFTTFPQGIVYIFCSNNFHTLFEGVDPTHIESVKSRFTFVTFELCGKEELCRYLTTFTERSTLPKLKYTPEHLNAAFAKIRPDLQVTYRDIQNLHRLHAGNIDVFVERINQTIYNPLMDILTPPKVAPFIPHPTAVISLPTPILQPTAVLPEVLSVNTAFTRLDKKKSMRDAAVFVINTVYKKDLGNSECYKLVMEKVDGMDFVLLSEQTVTAIKEDDTNEAFDDDVCDYCPLHAIASNGRVELLERLIRDGVDINVIDMESDGGTAVRRALYEAMSTTKQERVMNIRKCVEMLVGAGAKVFGVGILSAGININPGLSDAGNAAWLLEFVKRAFIREKPDVTKCAIVREFASNAHSADIIRYLCSVGVIPDTGSSSIVTACCNTAKKNNDDYLPVIRALVDCGANINPEQTTLLACLATSSSVEKIKSIAFYLLEHGAERAYRKVGVAANMNNDMTITREMKAFMTTLIG